MTAAFSRAFNDEAPAHVGQNGKSTWESAKEWFDEHFRFGWAAGIKAGPFIGGFVDAGSVKVGDRKGSSYWTTSGNIQEYSEGRTLTEASFFGLEISAKNTTVDNGKTWSYGDFELENRWTEAIYNQTITVDVKIGFGIIFEKQFTIDLPSKERE